MKAKGLLWLTTGIWLAIAAFLLRDSYLEYQDDKAELEVAREWGDPVKILIAENRLGRARWFLVGSSLGFTTGLGAVFRNVKIKDPSRAYQSMTSVLSFLLIFMFLAFWRAKRQDRQIRQRARRLRERNEELEREDGDGQG